MMQDETKRAEHTRLVLGMADRQDIDLPELVMRAEVSFDEMDEAIDKCLGCTQPSSCAQLLSSEAQSASLPAYCRNGDMFDRLKAQ